MGAGNISADPQTQTVQSLAADTEHCSTHPQHTQIVSSLWLSAYLTVKIT